MESVKKLPLDVRIEERPETNQNVIVPIFEQTREEAKIEMMEEGKDCMKDSHALKTKRTKNEAWPKKNSDDIIESQPEIYIPPQSKVGAKVQEEVQKNVISMIILILISIPLLDGSTWFSTVTIYDKSQNALVYFANNEPSSYQLVANQFVSTATK